MNAAAQRRLTAPLVAAVLLLGLVFLALLAGLGRGVRWAPPRAAAPLPAQHAATLPPPVPLEHFAPVWQQPLFNPDRKPVAHAASGGGQLGDLELTGVILTPGLRMALLHNKREGAGEQELRVREGTGLPDGNWTLVEIKPRSAVFDSPSGRVELQLPAGAPITRSNGAPMVPGAVPAEPSSVPNELPEDNGGHRLQPEPDKNDGQPEDNSQNPPPGPGPGPGTPESSSGAQDGGAAQNAGAAISALRGDAGNEMDNDARQAERLRLLKAAIEKRRAAQAAATAHEGDR